MKTNDFRKIERRQRQLINITYFIIIILVLALLGQFILIDYLSDIISKIQASATMKYGFILLILTFILYLTQKEREQSQSIKLLVDNLENSSMELESKVREVEFVNKASLRLADLNDRSAIKEFFDDALQFLGSDNGAISVCEIDTGCQPIVVSNLDDYNSLIIEDISAYVAKTGKSLLHEKNVTKEIDLPTNCAIAVPMRVNNKLFGIIAFWDKKSNSAYSEKELILLEIISRSISQAIYNQKLSEKHETMLHGSISILAEAVDSRESYRSEHSKNVAKYAIEMGNSIGLKDQQLRELEIAAFLHDIGFLMISSNILGKKGSLTEDERRTINMHSEYAYQMLTKLGFDAHICNVVRCHHEWYNGNGYPRGIRKDNIPIESRILTIADVYDALVTNRPYRGAFTHDEAITDMMDASGSQFDPRLVEVFSQTRSPRMYTV